MSAKGPWVSQVKKQVIGTNNLESNNSSKAKFRALPARVILELKTGEPESPVDPGQVAEVGGKLARWAEASLERKLRKPTPRVVQEIKCALDWIADVEDQRAAARRIAEDRIKRKALDRDAAWADLLSDVGLLPLDAPGSIAAAAKHLRTIRAEGWTGAVAVLKKRRNVPASPLYSPKKPVKRNLRSARPVPLDFGAKTKKH